MERFGTEEYGNKDGFVIVCNNCGKEGWIVPIHHHEGNDLKITLEFRCSCGNKFGAIIHNTK